MKYFRFLLIVGVVIVASPAGFAYARTYCPGETATLNYSIAQVALSSGGSCDQQIQTPPNYQSQSVDANYANTSGSVSYIVQQTGGAFSLTCRNSGGSPVTGSDTLTVATGAGLQACCGQWDLAGKVWDTTTQTCVTPTYSCQGTIPANASVYSGDNTGLTNNTTNYSYSATDTATKCQYSCNTGYMRDVTTNTCMASGSVVPRAPAWIGACLRI